MKRIKWILTSILTVAMAALGLSSCVDDELMNSRGQVVEGEPVVMSLNFSFVPQTDVIVTKADNTLSGINDLTLFIYSSGGAFQQVVSTTDGTLTLGTSASTTTNPDGRIRSVTFSTTSGTKQLLAVANMESNSVWSQLSEDAKNGRLSFDDLKKEVVAMSTHQYTDNSMNRPISITSGSQMMMSGWNTGVVFGPNGTVTNYGDRGVSTDNRRVAVRLDRSLARITFNIPAAPTNAKGTFTPSSYRIYNIPVNTYLTNTDLNLANTQWELVHTETANVGSAEGENPTYSFTFYVPENIVETRQGLATYRDREKWNNGEENVTTPAEEKDWTNAPPTATFVVISGTYEESSNNGTDNHDYTGNVSYTVHLGDFSNNQWGDFSVKRNWSYTYNMSVLSVDNIRIEVEATGDDEEYQQGAEGNIFDYSSTEYTYALDAHYEQVFLEYNLSDIASKLERGLNPDNGDLDDAIADNLILVIQSEAMDYSHTETTAEPYSVQNKRGTFRPYKIYADAVRDGRNATDAKKAVLDGAADSEGNPTKGFDYKWIEFWPQWSFRSLAKYPGVSDWSKEDLNGLDNQYVYGGPPTGNTSRLKDVYDIIVGMGKAIKKIYQNNTYSLTTGDTPNEDGICVVSSSGDYVARFTAFVNEYYYYKHPLTKADLPSWDVFVNKIPREMIIAMSTDRSQDGNSSFSQVYSYISQVSMETFYNSRNAAINAFGIETFNETPLTFRFNNSNTSSVSSNINNSLTQEDGYTNQKALLNNDLLWSTYINDSGNGWMSTVTSDRSDHKLDADAYNTQYAYAACMSRNRDLDGNGRIDDNEIRWYLPSANEYVRIGVGSNALSNAAQLYMGNKSQMTFGGYPEDYIDEGALYYTSSKNNARLFWAVERGSYGQEGDWAAQGKAKPIRCIRALPANTTEHDLSTVHVVSDHTYEVVNYGYGNDLITIKFSDRLADGLYRDPTNTDLDPHDEDDEANRFSEGIFVASQPLDDSESLADIIGYQGTIGGTYYDGTKLNPCASHHEGGYNSGWRVPNLVELSAMNAAGFTTSGMASCTQFSEMDVRFGFVFTDGIIMCPGEKDGQIQWSQLTGDDRKIRCVRDVPNGYFD